ncbi:hypothetical protein [Nocardioides yefusunii]|uniref:Uncharacterized protein n=1 Tax=Nocardioides yefusunii TaxID=2500546 RepID=A0ABW1QXK1_9ACTN|nr:hypothetical protein [Nocardioides yefusunii]
MTNADTFFHLRLGDEFRADWSISSPGTVTEFANRDWTSTQWLAQLGMAQAEAWGGLRGVAVLTALAVVFLAFSFYFSTRFAGTFAWSALIIPVALFSCAMYLTGRPQVLSYAFAALVTGAWASSLRSGRTPWWTIGLTWLWSALHGMWPVALLVGATAVLGMAVDRSVRPRQLGKHATCLTASALIVLISPVGLDVYRAVFRVGAISEYFLEWGPANFRNLTGVLAVLLVLATIVLASRKRDSGWAPLLLALLSCAWILYSARTVPIGVAMSVPLLALLGTDPGSARRIPWEIPIVVIAAAEIAVSCTVWSKGLEQDPRATSAAHASVDSLPHGTALLNDWGEGGYDMWRHRDLQILMHGYGDMFTNSELKRNYNLSRLEPGWYQEITGLGLREALLPSESALTAALIEDKGWVVVAKDIAPRKRDVDATTPMTHLRAP